MAPPSDLSVGLHVMAVSALSTLLLVLAWTPHVTTESFTSIAGLKSLVNHEDFLLEQLQEYIQREEDRLQSIRSQAEALSNLVRLRNESTEDQWEERVNKLVEHPLGAFSVIKSWYQISEAASGTSTETISAFSSAAEQRGVSVPGNLDYKGAITGLLRLQKTYKLPSREMAQGQVYGVQADHGLELSDLLELGVTAMEVDHYLAMSWFDLALEQLQNNTDRDMEILIYTHKLTIYKQCGDTERAYICGQRLVHLDPNNSFRIQELEHLKQRVDEETRAGRLHMQHYYWKSARDKGLEQYESLCKGDNIANTIFVNKDLMCIYRRGVLPYVVYKEEIHSFSPRISLMIDVISDRQADMLKAKAFPSLYRAQVGDPSKSVVSEERVSKLSWLWDTDPEVAHISQNVGAITGLDTTYSESQSSSEAFQIVNYGLGGQYEPHYDFYEHEEMLQRLPAFLLNTGDRIATFMFYLSDVQAGGATVFPSIGVRVPARKNAAAFWYNFDLAGHTGDRRTLHAGCPVLLGQKWVGNKWIRQLGQAFKRPCAVDQYQTDPVYPHHN